MGILHIVGPPYSLSMIAPYRHNSHWRCLLLTDPPVRADLVLVLGDPPVPTLQHLLSILLGCSVCPVLLQDDAPVPPEALALRPSPLKLLTTFFWCSTRVLVRALWKWSTR